MDVRDLLDGLGYTSSGNCLQGDELDRAPGFGHVFRRAKDPRAKQPIGLEAVYCLRQPAQNARTAASRTLVPITYVCQAKTLDDADRIHRLVWNQSVAPFVVVLAPQGVRLYSGFELRPRVTKSRRGSWIAEDDLSNAVRGLRELSLSAESIDSGAVWDTLGAKVRPQHRVEWHLLDDLRKLEGQIVAGGLDDRPLVHALIGKYVYLHYLRERGILSDERLAKWELAWDKVSGRTVELGAFARLCDSLEVWLNGSVFPLGAGDLKRIGRDALRKVAAVFEGDSPDGQYHLDFPAYDFSYIPVETLSVIYEQFLHATPRMAGESAGEHQAAYYTPVPVVNFIIDRMEEFHPLRPPMRTCDFSVGSGTFLVQCYRKLIEDRLRSQPRSAKVRPTALRDLLVDHIFGMDADADACSVAEFSLLLTLLDYVDPPDLTNTTFKLPTLSGKNIVQGNAFDDQHDFVRNARRSREAAARGLFDDEPVSNTGKRGFDWIIGNPPWKDLKATTADPLYGPVLDWMKAHKTDKPTGGNQTAEAFAWRTQDFARRGALAGLLLPAMTLFKDESTAFRERFFSENEPAYVANFSNLAEVLFAGRSRVSAAAVVFWPGQPSGSPDGARRIPVFSPLVANQEVTRPRVAGTRIEAWTIVVDEGEVRPVDVREIQRGDALTWKLAAWGSHLDQAILRRTASLPSLHALLESAGMVISQGLELRRKPKKPSEALEPHPELAGRPLLVTTELARLDRFFSFPPSAIRRVEEEETYVRVRGGFERPESVCRPPHVLVSAARNWAVFSDDYLIVPPRQIGIAGDRVHGRLLKALALYLNSDFVRYHQFFLSPQQGVKREESTLGTLLKLPIPANLAEGADLQVWINLYDRLATHDRKALEALGTETHEQGKTDLIAELNELVNSALDLRKLDCVRVSDFVDVLFGLRDGKVEERAVAPASNGELRKYAQTLKHELDAFIGTSENATHAVEIWHDDDRGVIQVDLLRQNGTIIVHPRSEGVAVLRQVARLRAQLQSGFAQWRYFNRNLRLFVEDRTYLFKPMQRFHWIESQAVLDASEVIGLVLDQAVSEERPVGERA